MEELEMLLDAVDYLLLDNPPLRWGTALGITVGVYLGLQLIKALAIRNLARLARRTKTIVDDAVVAALRRTTSFASIIIAIYLGSLALELPPIGSTVLQTAAIIALIFQVGLWIDGAIMFWLRDYQRKTLVSNAAQATTMQAIGFITRTVLFSLVTLLALDNIPGVEVTPLLASLGVAGIAVSLALQGVLSDLFASIAISLDKPFVLNDFIIVGEYLGSVEKIGVKTTHLRSLSGEQLIFPNSDLVNSRIRNFKRMEERRIVFSLGVTYDTSYEQLQDIPDIIKQIIMETTDTRFDRAHFFSYGDFSLVFEVVYHVLSPDFNKYMDIQQAINLAIFKEFQQRGIQFAFPTQTLYVAGQSGNGVEWQRES